MEHEEERELMTKHIAYMLYRVGLFKGDKVGKGGEFWNNLEEYWMNHG